MLCVIVAINQSQAEHETGFLDGKVFSTAKLLSFINPD
jgi:hypothetical protein